MYLEERVARVEAFMELFLSEHPDMCPHQWITESGSYMNQQGQRVISACCRFCGKHREIRAETQKDSVSNDYEFSF